MQAENRLSTDRLIQFIAFVFALTLTQSFARYGHLIVRPSLSLPFVALLAVFYTVLASWLFYNRLLVRYPYENNLFGILRFGLDFVIAGVNGYLLLTVALIEQDSNARPYLMGYVAIYFLYIVSGILRRVMSRDPSVSLVGLIVAPFFFTLFLASIYPYALSASGAWASWLNWAFVLAAPIADLAYRVKRWQGVW